MMLMEIRGLIYCYKPERRRRYRWAQVGRTLSWNWNPTLTVWAAFINLRGVITSIRLFDPDTGYYVIRGPGGVVVSYAEGCDLYVVESRTLP